MLSLVTKLAVLAAVALALPNGALTPKFVAQLHAAGSQGKCLDVRGGVLQNGTPLQVYDCGKGGPQGQLFLVNGGRGDIRVAGTDYCVDTGSAPLNDGNKVKIWKCHGGYQQIFEYTREGRIRVPGQNVCLDITDGKLENGNPIQIYSCGDLENDNQYFPAKGVVQPRM